VTRQKPPQYTVFCRFGPVSANKAVDFKGQIWLLDEVNSPDRSSVQILVKLHMVVGSQHLFLVLVDPQKAAKWRGSWKPRVVTLTVASSIMEGRMDSNKGLETYPISQRTNVVSASYSENGRNRQKPSVRSLQDFGAGLQDLRGASWAVAGNIMKGRMGPNQALETYSISWRTNVVSATCS